MSVSECLSVKLFHCAFTAAICRRPSRFVFPRLMAFIKLLPLKFTAFEALRDSHYPNFGFFHLFSFFLATAEHSYNEILGWRMKIPFDFVFSIFRLLVYHNFTSMTHIGYWTEMIKRLIVNLGGLLCIMCTFHPYLEFFTFDPPPWIAEEYSQPPSTHPGFHPCWCSQPLAASCSSRHLESWIKY